MQRFLLNFVYWICIFTISTLLISASNSNEVEQKDTVKYKSLGVQKEIDRNSQQPTNFPQHEQHIILGQKLETSSEKTAENSQLKSENKPQVLISEVVVVGENLTPELEKLVHETTSTNPGYTTTRSQLQEDVNAVYATGFFQNVAVTPEDTPLGVRITFAVELNPILNSVVVITVPHRESSSVLLPEKVNEIFGKNYGQILNLRELQQGIIKVNLWYSENGYELAQVVGSPQVSPEGEVILVTAEGIIEDIQVRHFDEEDDESQGNIEDFIITREIELKPGDVFKRDTAQKDLLRAFDLGFFEDMRFSFSTGSDPSKVVINVDAVEIQSPLYLAEVLITLKKTEYLQPALNIYQQELQKYQSQTASLGQARALAELAGAYRKFGNLEQTISLYNRILSLSRMSQNPITLDDQLELKELNVEYFKDTNSLELGIYGLAPQLDEIVTFVNQAEIYRLLGDYQQAFDSIKKAQFLWEKKKDSLSQELKITEQEDFLSLEVSLELSFKQALSAFISTSISTSMSFIYSDLGQDYEASYHQKQAQQKLKNSFYKHIQEYNKQLGIDPNSMTDEDLKEFLETGFFKEENRLAAILFGIFIYIKEDYTVLFKALQLEEKEIESFFEHSIPSKLIPIVKELELKIENYNEIINKSKKLIRRGEQSLIIEDNQQALIHYHEAIKLLLQEEKQLENKQLENKQSRNLEGKIELDKLELDKLNNINIQADVLSRIGRIHWSLAETSQALDFFKQALELFQKIENFQGQVDTLILLGQIYVNLTQYAKALTYYDQADQVLNKLSDPSLTARVLFEKAVVKRIQSNYLEAKDLIETALNRLEFQRCVVQDNQNKLVRGACPEIFTPFSETKSIRFKSYINLASYIESKQKYYEFYIDLLMEIARQDTKSDYSIQALKASEDNRARSLVALLKSARGNSQKTSQKTTNIKLPESPSIKEIQQQILDDNTVLLDYVLGKERSYLWLVTQDEVESFILPKGADIEAVAKEFYDHLTIPSLRIKENKTAEVGLKLSQMLLSPVAKKLGQKRLLIVGDGILQYMPFSAIPIPQSENITKGVKLVETVEPLLVKHEIITLPSVSTLVAIRDNAKNNQSAPQTLGIFADPVFGQQKEEQIYSSLPQTREQAQQIIATLPKNAKYREFFDYDANRQQAINSELSQYQILHFATHAILDQKRPERSGIVLSAVTPEEELQRGLLSTTDAFRLNLSAELVVLSGCRTGLGKTYRGEGVVGLTAGFLSAGAERVAVSLWSVEDEATSELMKRFYQGIFQQKLSPSRALREAQLAMWQDKKWHIPYYWGAFTIQGEWKDIKRR